MFRLFDVPIYKGHEKLIEIFLKGGEPTGIPYLEKTSIIRQFPEAFRTKKMSDALDRKSVEYASTSGSSGERLTLIRASGWWDREYEDAYSSNSELKGFDFASDRKAILATVFCSGGSCGIADTTVEMRLSGRTLYLNAKQNPHDWTEIDIQRIAAELNEFKPKVLQVNPSYLTIFIDKLVRFQVELPYIPEAIVSAYEFLTSYCRTRIETFFGRKVLDMFGSSELGVLFMQDAAGSYNRCPHASIVELSPVYPKGRIYELVITSWKNPLMPFLRYRTGDLIETLEVPQAGGVVRAGEQMAIARPHGRWADAQIFSDDQRYITPYTFDKLISECAWQPKFYRLEKRGDRIVFLYVETEPHSSGCSPDENFQFLNQLFCDKQVILQKVEILQPEQSGKFFTFRSA